MSDIIRQLHIDHVNASRLLDFLEQQIETIHNVEISDHTLMFDAMHYMANYSDLVHHPTEDLIYARLRLRASDTGDALDQLNTEHLVLADKGAQFLELLDNIESETMMISRELLETRGMDYISLLRKHIDLEESQVFPLIRQTLIEEDWRNIDSELKKQEDPVFGGIVSEEYRKLYNALEPYVSITS